MTADKLIALFVVCVVTSLTKILPLKKPWGRSVTGRDHKFVTAPADTYTIVLAPHRVS